MWWVILVRTFLIFLLVLLIVSSLLIFVVLAHCTSGIGGSLAAISIYFTEVLSRELLELMVFRLISPLSTWKLALICLETIFAVIFTIVWLGANMIKLLSLVVLVVGF